MKQQYTKSILALFILQITPKADGSFEEMTGIYKPETNRAIFGKVDYDFQQTVLYNDLNHNY